MDFKVVTRKVFPKLFTKFGVGLFDQMFMQGFAQNQCK